MKLGFVSAILPDLNLSQVLEVAAQTGYSTVELMCWPPGGADRRERGKPRGDRGIIEGQQARTSQGLEERRDLVARRVACPRPREGSDAQPRSVHQPQKAGRQAGGEDECEQASGAQQRRTGARL